MKKTAITLLSGGLDSAVATLLARRECDVPLALTFDYGQRAAGKEIEAARKFCTRYGVAHEAVELPWLSKISGSALTDKSVHLPSFTDMDLNEGDAKTVWVPNRNAVFVSIAAAYAEAKGYDCIIAGFNAEEAATFPDNSAGFVESANRLLSSSTLSRPRLVAPLQEMAKAEIARSAVSLDLPPQFFWSCYDGGARMCARCESCARTIRAFKEISAWELVSDLFDK